MLNHFTRQMMERLPQWMKMARDEKSVGAQFLDVFGLALEEVENYLTETIENRLIGTAHVEMVDILYKVPLSTEQILDFEQEPMAFIRNNEGALERAFVSGTLREFYKAGKENRVIIDRGEGMVYIRVDMDRFTDLDAPFQSIVINGVDQYDLILHHVWNAFDEFGFLLGLKRLHGERNAAFKERILDVFINPGNSSKQGIINGMARELGITRESITLHTLKEAAFQSELFERDGSPTPKMIDYAKRINETLRFTWDTMNFGEAYWHSVEEDLLGLKFLPHIWDADMSMFRKDEFQSGVGDQDDLKVFKPETVARERTFKTFVSVMGYIESPEMIYPEIEFRYKVFATGKVPNQDYKEEPFRYTVRAAERTSLDYKVGGSQRFDWRHELNLGASTDYVVENNGIVFGKSNDVLHPETDPIVRLDVEMTTVNPVLSPALEELVIVYEDTNGAEQQYLWTTQADFTTDKNATGGGSLTNVEMRDTFVTTTGEVELGFGSFYRVLDTNGDFNEGQYDASTIVVKDGSVGLNLSNF